MEPELVKYVIDHYGQFMTNDEKLAHQHVMALEKAAYSNSPTISDLVMNRFGSRKAAVLKLLQGGPERFRQKVVERILQEHASEVFLNNCPACGKLTRTPKAMQCPHCFHGWH